MCAYTAESSYWWCWYFFPRCMLLHQTLFSILSAEKVWKKLAYYYVCMEQTLIMSIRRSLTHSALIKYQYDCKNADFYSYLPPTAVSGCQSSYSGVIKKWDVGENPLQMFDCVNIYNTCCQMWWYFVRVHIFTLASQAPVQGQKF